MSRDEKALRVDLRPDTLRDTEGKATHKRSPKRSRAAYHGSLKREEQLRCAGVGIKCSSHGKRGASDTDCHHCNSGSATINTARIDAQKTDGIAVNCRRSDRAT